MLLALMGVLLLILIVSNKIYWAGGVQTREGRLSCSVEIRDVITGETSIQYLSKPGAWSAHVGQNAVVKDNKIIFMRTNNGDNFCTSCTY